MPGVVPVELVLGRSADAVVVLTEMRAYPTGVELAVGVRLHPDARRGGRGSPDTLLDMDDAGGYADEAEWQAERLVWELELADGRRVTSVDADPFRELLERGQGRGDRLPDPPVLVRRNGVGHADRAERSYWLWPLPPPGRLRVACRWPARGIERTVSVLDADLVRAAAARARPLWPDASGG
jgi:hypothetical protein